MISPSALPESMSMKLNLFLAMTVMPSLCCPMDSRKGFANTFSSFTAFSALLCSLAFWNGCKISALAAVLDWEIVGALCTFCIWLFVYFS